MAEDYEAEEAAFLAAHAAEWGTYVANGPIYHNGARAYNDGDPVPVSNVEKWKYVESGQVHKVGEPAPVVESPASAPKHGEDILLHAEDESAPAAPTDPAPADHTEGS